MTAYEIETVYEKERGNFILHISYKCPKCGMGWQTLWMFPEVPMLMPSECCGILMEFEPREEFK